MTYVKLWLKWQYVKPFNWMQRKSLDSFTNVYKMNLQIIYLIHMYEQILAFNNLQYFTCQ